MNIFHSEIIEKSSRRVPFTPNCGKTRKVSIMVKPARTHTRFERARIIGARALQIGMGAPLFAEEEHLREAFKNELISLYGLDEADIRFVLDPLKIAMYEYDHELIPIDIDPHLE